jgi:hypothetical protein
MNQRNFYIFIFCVVTLVAYNNCGKNGFEGAISPSSSFVLSNGSSGQSLPISGTEANVMKITLGCGYINEPCVSVTICSPGTASCQTIPNVLLDTGSYGLRLFSSSISVSLPAKTVGSGTLTECVSYADGSSQWGPVKSADIILGQRKAASIPVQIIDSTFGSIPADCTKPDTNASDAGYNGILGIGGFAEDCGAGCASVANNRIYFSCSGATCTPTTVPIAQQVSNPIPFLPEDNNGVALQFAAVPAAGTTALSGWLVLGIGTQTNNTPGPVNVFPGDSNGYFLSSFNGKTYSSSFIDSGSNGLFFPGSAVIPLCGTSGFASGFFCPASAVNLTAIQAGKSGTPAVSVSFQIANAEQELAVSNPNIIFNNLGGNAPDNISGSFDWGLPFYLGRTVFHGYDGKTSTLGTGPYFAW